MGEPMTQQNAVISILRTKQAAPRREDSPGYVLLHVQTAVLRALVWNGGPGYCCQEPSCYCDGLSSFGPLTGPVFISLCDLQWPCTVRWNVAPDSVLLPWEHGPKAGVGFSPHAGIPIPQGRRSLKRLGALPQEPCHHTPPLLLCFPCWQAPTPTSTEVGRAMVPKGPGHRKRNWCAFFPGRQHPGVCACPWRWQAVSYGHLGRMWLSAY